MAFNKHGPVHQGRAGQYVGTHWYDDIAVIADEARQMPATVPDEILAAHPYECACAPCRAYPSQALWELKYFLRHPERRRR